MARSTREAYGLALERLGDTYDYYVLDADLSKATKTNLFAQKYPERFFNIGISEGDMMSTAAGMASCGNTVFASSFAVFAAGRAFEQIRNSIAYPQLNVKIAATHGGVLIGEDGGSHQAIEDIALMRSLPNMTVICPCDELSVYAAVENAILSQGPVYLRFGRLSSPAVYQKKPEYLPGHSSLLASGTDVAILAIGDMVSIALDSRLMLKEEGINAAVVDMYSVKPLDRNRVLEMANATKAIITAEDHSIIGGLGSAVAEVLAEEHIARLRRIGIKDTFGRSGKPAHLAKHFSLTAHDIVSACHDLLNRK